MGKERKSARERRDVYFKLREGTLVRRTPSDLELSTYFRAVDHKDLNAFGVRTLAEIDLNLLKNCRHATPDRRATTLALRAA